MSHSIDPNSLLPAGAESTKRVSFWEKLGGGALSIAVIVHLIAIIAAGIWIYQVIHPVPEKEVDFIQGGGGGGPRGPESERVSKVRKPLMPVSSARRVVIDGVGGVVLQDPGMEFGEFSPLGSPGAGSLGGGFGGTGTGKGLFGDGDGPGPGLNAPGGLGTNPFGMIDPNANSLEGSFYDLKQTRGREPTGVTVEQTREIIRDFVNGGWKDRDLAKYYKAGRTLYQNRIHIPLMPAEQAPAAFDCEKEVQPSRWVVVYRGSVTPPKTARYRFVGAGDDVLVVRFNGRHVFDHGFTSGTTGIYIASHVPFFKGETENDELRKLVRRDYPMKLPVTYHEYPTTRNWNRSIGGLAVGAEFEAVAGRSYPIEILISEIPGGLFCASLLIEEVGADHPKDPSGAPVLPLFRLDSGLPEVAPGADNAPPFDPAGPVWKRTGGSAYGGI